MSDTHKSDLLLIVVTLFAAISWMFSKEAILLMPPLMFMAARFLIAGTVLAFFARRGSFPDQPGGCDCPYHCPVGL